EAARKHGKQVAMLTDSLDGVREMIALGATIINYSSDAAVLRAGYAGMVEAGRRGRWRPALGGRWRRGLRASRGWGATRSIGRLACIRWIRVYPASSRVLVRFACTQSLHAYSSASCVSVRLACIRRLRVYVPSARTVRFTCVAFLSRVYCSLRDRSPRVYPSPLSGHVSRVYRILGIDMIQPRLECALAVAA